MLGLAYKPDIDDVRESPSFELIEKLESRGAHVDYHDPLVARTHPMRHHSLEMRSITLTPEALAKYDCVVISTNHSSYNWQEIAEHSQLIVDSRNAMKGVRGRRDHIIAA